MYPRLITSRLRSALKDTRVVLLSGPRQAGKTTLAQSVSSEAMPYLTLDDRTTLTLAREDPVGFVRGLDRAVIDEVQRAPQLLLALKRSVDTDKRPGRFLLTGSASLDALPQVSDSLAGRIETLELLPLAQSELLESRNTFLSRVFEGRAPQLRQRVVGDALIERVLAGGYPEALTRGSPARRQKWLLDYARAIALRDVRELAQLDHARQLPRLLRLLAVQSGQLTNFSALGASLGLTHVTARRYTELLAQIYLIRLLPPWFNNELSRLTKSSKIHFLDSGLLAALRNLSVSRLKADRMAFGALLESFVYSELQKLAAAYDDLLEFHHFRDREGREVDLVIENADGRIVGIEVKASATVGSADFTGLRTLAVASGPKFAMGIVLCDTDAIVPFGPKLCVAPVSTLS